MSLVHADLVAGRCHKDSPEHIPKPCGKIVIAVMTVGSRSAGQTVHAQSADKSSCSLAFAYAYASLLLSSSSSAMVVQALSVYKLAFLIY